MAVEQQACVNTDVHLFTDADGNEIFRTDGGALGINVGGLVIVKAAASWHALAKASLPPALREETGAIAPPPRSLCIQEKS